MRLSDEVCQGLADTVCIRVSNSTLGELFDPVALSALLPFPFGFCGLVAVEETEWHQSLAQVPQVRLERPGHHLDQLLILVAGEALQENEVVRRRGSWARSAEYLYISFATG